MMLYRTQRRLIITARLLGMPLLGMMLAMVVSATTAWAPAEIVTRADAIVIVLN